MVTPRLVLCIGLSLASLLAPHEAQAREGLSLSPDTQVYVVPSFAVNYAVFRRDAVLNASGFHSGFHMWSGIAVHPLAGDALSPYLAIGVETEFGRSDGGPPYQHTAMTRLGLSMMLGDGTWVEAMLPALSIYAMAGARPAVDAHPPAARLGVGLNSFWLPLLLASEAATIIPGSYEGLVELQGNGERRFMLRFGMGF